MLVNNEVGTVQPLADVVACGRAPARPARSLHTDAVQAVPWLDVACAAAGADLVSVSAHKFGGPKGVGALVVRDGVAVEPLIEGGGQERGLRSGTVERRRRRRDGDGAARSRSQHAPPTRRARRARCGSARRRPARASRRRSRTARGQCKVAGNAHVGFRGVEAEALLVLLDQHGVFAAAGSSCSSGATEPSHVLAAMGVAPADAPRVDPVSLGCHVDGRRRRRARSR